MTVFAPNIASDFNACSFKDHCLWMKAEIERLRAELAEEKELRKAEFQGYHLAVRLAVRATEEQYEARIAELRNCLQEGK